MMNLNRLKLASGAAVLALCACATFAPSAFAQSGRRGGMGRSNSVDQQLATLTSLLTLTPDQQTGVKAILVQQSTQIQALRTQSQSSSSDSEDERQARMTKIQQIHEESETSISALLDDTQKKTYADWLQKQKASMQQRQQQGGSPPANNSSAPAPNSSN